MLIARAHKHHCFSSKIKGERLLLSLRGSYMQVPGSIPSKFIMVGIIMLEDVKLLLIYQERHSGHPQFFSLGSQNPKTNVQAQL